MVTKMAAWKGAMAGEKSGLPALVERIVPHTQRQVEKRIAAEEPSLALTPGIVQLQEEEEEDLDVNLSEVYFLIMHFLSSGPCNRATGQLWNELLQHKLLPRRYHAWFSRTGLPSGDEDDDGISFPLSYIQVVERHPNIEKNHLVKLLRQQLIASRRASVALQPPNSRIPTAADVPTVLGRGSFSLLNTEPTRVKEKTPQLLLQLRWPHWQSSQVRGLTLRELGGGFSRHHHSPSIRAASYAIMKPSVLVDKIQIIKKFRGHRNAVYCAIFDRTGQHIITGSDDRLVKIWSTETGFCLRSCRGHEGDITELSVSSGNTLVASASNDCTIRVWHLPDGVPVSVLRGHTAAVTAIAFSPRQSCEHHLLSSSDDGTCRIWDARDSFVKSRVYMPNPEASNPSAKSNAAAAQPAQQAGLQISCCAFNADGSIFVTGSSDRVARVWDARKWNDEITGKPNHELDVLKGHENAVNYVQFSGCAGLVKPYTIESAKEDRATKFKNSWLTRDSIVTCSRDGSAIIWIYKSRRKDARYGRWTKAYHLRVPPPPMPPHPPRGGPRQRFLPTPRGVNMIVWSLDNRFVLAAIMDCRICVWNAVDGSLLHSLTGHTKSTFVVDVHPFDPRIAMSAGYDGRVIIWDIWEGRPVRVYETGDFQIVDGSFSPDGASLVVSDEVGQVYLLTTGQGQSQKDAKYDQFFLGDFRPLVRDIQGNVLDQETQLPPHQRNIQDLLCDANMIPYQEPYQSMYQQRRLGALGIEWQPFRVNLSVGIDDINYVSFGDHPLTFHPNIQGSPVDTAEDGARRRWVEQPTDADEEIDWEQDVTRLSDDSGSDYSVTEESLSLLDDDDEGTASSSEGLGHSDEEGDSEEESVQEIQLRRSNRNKRKAEGTPRNSLGKKVRKLPPDLQTVDGRVDDGMERRCSRKRQAALESSIVRPGFQLQSARPKRVAAKNALQLFSHISTNEEGDEEEASSSHQETSSYSTEQEPESEGSPRSLPLSSDQKNDEDIHQTQEKDELMEAEGREEVSESIGEQVMFQTNEKEVVGKDEREEDLEDQENPEKNARGEDPRSNLRQESPSMFEKDEIFCEDENDEDFEMVAKEDAFEKNMLGVRQDMSEPGEFSRRPRSQRRLVLKLRKNEIDIMGSFNKMELQDTASAGENITRKVDQITTTRDHTKRKMRRLIVKPPQAAPLFHDSFGGLSDTADNGDYGGIQNTGFMTTDHEKDWLPGNYRRHFITKERKIKGQSAVVQVSKRVKAGHKTATVEPTGSSPSSVSCSSARSASICEPYQDRSGEAAGGVYPGVALGISSHTYSGGINGAGNSEALPAHFDLPRRGVESPGKRLEPSFHRPSSPESSGRFHPSKTRDSNIYEAREEEALQDDKLKTRSSIGTKSNQVDINSQMNNARCRWWHTLDHRDRMAVEEEHQQDDVGKTHNSPRGVGYKTDNAVRIRKGRRTSVQNTSEKVDDYDDSHFLQISEEGDYKHYVSENPLESTVHPSSTKRIFVFKGFESKEKEVYTEDSNGPVQGSSGERGEEGQHISEGHSESDFSQDNASDFSQDNASWSESESAERGHGDAHYLRHKRRTLGEIESTNHAIQNSSEDLMGKRRVRHMRSVMLEGVRDTRVKGNRGRRAAVNKEKEASENQGSSRRLSTWTNAMSWRNNFEGESSGVHVDCTADRLTQDFDELLATNSNRSRGTDLGRSGQGGASVPMEKKELRVSSRTRREITRTLDRDQQRQVETITMMRDKGVRTRKSLAWLLLSEVEEGTRYIPQFGDEVAYFRQGHEEYLNLYKIDEPGPWTTYKDAVRAVEICQVVDLEYTILPDSRDTCCKFTLEFLDRTSQLQGKTFWLTLPELTNFPDFIVEKSRYDTSIERRWTNRDRCKVWWRSQNGQGGEWWEGRVVAVKPKSFDFPESPWDRFMVQYKSDPNKPYGHSPWELFDPSDARWEPPHIDQHTRERLLSVLQSAANEPEDAYGLRRLKQSSCRSEFINRLPLPLTLDVLKQRLEKDYYHSTRAFYSDVQLLATNAQRYCGIQHPMSQGLQAFARDMWNEISCESSS